MKLRASDLVSGDRATVVLRGPKLREYERAKEIASGFDLDLDQALQRLGTLIRRCVEANGTLEQAVEYWLSHRSTKKLQAAVGEVVDAYVASRVKNGNSPEDIKDVRNRLRRFARAFDRPLAEITREDYVDYLDRLQTGAYDRSHHRSSILRLVRWAKEVGYLPFDHPGMPNLATRVKIAFREPVVQSVEYREQLLACALPEEMPIALLKWYTPVRSRESMFIDWKDFSWDRATLALYGDETKSRVTRHLSLPDELVRRLAPYRQPVGRLYPYENPYYLFQKLARKAGVKWNRNGFRSTVISCLHALIRNREVIADEAGTSPGVIKRHYLKVVDNAVARNWFGLKHNERHPLEFHSQGNTTFGARELPPAALPPNVIALPIAI